MEREELNGVCGLYCGACSLYRAWHDDLKDRLKEIREYMSSRGEVTEEDLHCDGCFSQGKLSPYCRECEIRLCAAEKPGVTWCSACPDFPCDRLIAFNDDGVRHHAEVLDNVHRQREVGVEQWNEEQYERWRCVYCGLSMDWYAKSCYRCSTAQPRRLPSLPRDKK